MTKLSAASSASCSSKTLWGRWGCRRPPPGQLLGGNFEKFKQKNFVRFFIIFYFLKFFKGDVASKWKYILCTDPSCQNRFILTVHWINCVKLFCLTNRKSGNHLWQLGPVQEIYIFLRGHVSFLFFFLVASSASSSSKTLLGRWQCRWRPPWHLFWGNFKKLNKKIVQFFSLFPFFLIFLIFCLKIKIKDYCEE